MIIVVLKPKVVWLTKQWAMNQQLVIYNLELVAQFLWQLESITFCSEQWTCFGRSIHVVDFCRREDFCDIVIELAIRLLSTKRNTLHKRIFFLKRKQQTIEGRCCRNVSHLLTLNQLIYFRTRLIKDINQSILIHKCLEKNLQTCHMGWIIGICPNLSVILLSLANWASQILHIVYNLFGLSCCSTSEDGNLWRRVLHGSNHLFYSYFTLYRQSFCHVHPALIHTANLVGIQVRIQQNQRNVWRQSLD